MLPASEPEPPSEPLSCCVTAFRTSPSTSIFASSSLTSFSRFDVLCDVGEHDFASFWRSRSSISPSADAISAAVTCATIWSVEIDVELAHPGGDHVAADVVDQLVRVDAVELLPSDAGELADELGLRFVERAALLGELVDDLVGDRVEDRVGVASELVERCVRELIARAACCEGGAAGDRDESGDDDRDDRRGLGCLQTATRRASALACVYLLRVSATSLRAPDRNRVGRLNRRLRHRVVRWFP